MNTPESIIVSSSSDKMKNTSSAEIFQSPISNRKRVLFGPKLSPEIFDLRLPSASPLRKGKKPLITSIPQCIRGAPGTLRLSTDQMLLQQSESILPNKQDLVVTPSKSLLKRRSPTPVKAYMARTLGFFVPTGSARKTRQKSAKSSSISQVNSLHAQSTSSSTAKTQNAKTFSTGKVGVISKTNRVERCMSETPTFSNISSSKEFTKKTKSLSPTFSLGLQQFSSYELTKTASDANSLYSTFNVKTLKISTPSTSNDAAASTMNSSNLPMVTKKSSQNSVFDIPRLKDVTQNGSTSNNYTNGENIKWSFSSYHISLSDSILENICQFMKPTVLPEKYKHIIHKPEIVYVVGDISSMLNSSPNKRKTSIGKLVRSLNKAVCSQEPIVIDLEPEDNFPRGVKSSRRDIAATPTVSTPATPVVTRSGKCAFETEPHKVQRILRRRCAEVLKTPSASANPSSPLISHISTTHETINLVHTNTSVRRSRVPQAKETNVNIRTDPTDAQVVSLTPSPKISRRTQSKKTAATISSQSYEIIRRGRKPVVSSGTSSSIKTVEAQIVAASPRGRKADSFTLLNLMNDAVVTQKLNTSISVKSIKRGRTAVLSIPVQKDAPLKSASPQKETTYKSLKNQQKVDFDSMKEKLIQNSHIKATSRNKTNTVAKKNLVAKDDSLSKSPVKKTTRGRKDALAKSKHLSQLIVNFARHDESPVNKYTRVTRNMKELLTAAFPNNSPVRQVFNIFFCS